MSKERELLARARNMLSHPDTWASTPEHKAKRGSLVAEITQLLYATKASPPAPVAPQPINDQNALGRVAFEAWRLACVPGIDMSRDMPDGSYNNPNTYAQW